MLIKKICAVFLLLCTQHALSQTVVKASDYGVKSNSFQDAASGIRKAIETCNAKKSAVLLLPGGRIDIWPEKAVKRELYISNCTENDTLPKVKSIAFLFEHCRNLTLDGNNTLVVLHGKMVSFALLNSVNVKLKDISFDYERPTMSELTIQSVTDTVIEAKIHPDSKFSIDSGRISFYGEGWKARAYHAILFDPQNETLCYSSFSPFMRARAVQTGPFQVRFEGKFAGTGFHGGDVLTVRDPYRDNCGGFISLSKNIALENVKMHYMHGLGIVSQFSENISLVKVRVVPRESSGRVIASFADCFHFSGCKGLVKIDSCVTSGSHDDPVNVHGTHLQIIAVDSAKKIKVRFMHDQTYGFEAFFAGDSIAFIDPKTLMPLGTAKLKTAKLISHREMEIEVKGDLGCFVKAGLCIENLTWTPEVIIRNSRFERTDTRGLLITTRGKVLIENNVFYHTGMFPILIADDASSWYESGAVQDVTIRNNLFESCGYNSGSGAINIAPENHELVVGNMVHRNIRIINNTFNLCTDGVLSARSVDHLLFSENKIRGADLSAKGNNKATIKLTACKNVRVDKNRFYSLETPSVDVVKMGYSDVKTDLKVDLEE
ncbi:right-handed parallel beta-helix repeat-containing protein [Mucilaginibacter sp. BT774]|uniref:right-handed parallel beta-helix repeat-containing protein n=1 Tax=Mucilaginibacter sp. BT774 TaxID=3062276 RepID=UPI0026770723|nr:right-handed parallel beta-helix repeat-containing protein [Mucilaginibacter sp. BT774]MDO3627530.1 right-handed parallel beta-helix repeat-containing protein [Mucilaginibacter sp. BT774]